MFLGILTQVAIRNIVKLTVKKTIQLVKLRSAVDHFMFTVRLQDSEQPKEKS